MALSIPHSVLASGWIPFTVVLVLAFLFAWVYIRLFQHHELAEVSSTLTAVIGLFAALLTSAVVPVDVFLVSYMKNSNGTFKEWAASNATRQSVEMTVTYTYYALYSLAAFFIFILLPFMYFYFEEKDDGNVTVKQRCCTSFKYTLVFLLAAVIILLVGAFVPLKSSPANATIVNQFDNLGNQLERYNHADQAVSILIAVMSMFGMLSLVMYAGFGMSALPIGMIRCQRKFKEEDNRHERDQEKARILRAKSRSGKNLSRFERKEMRRIEEEEKLLNRIERKKERMKKSKCGKILLLLKPVEVVLGLLLFVLSGLMIASLLITNVEKLKYSTGPKSGYTYPTSEHRQINICDIIMTYAQKIFPLDYILLCIMVVFFVFASMAGLKKIGICCCCIKMFKIRRNKTMPQALTFMVFLLMLMVISLNTVMLTLLPQYVQYGNQVYFNVKKNSTVPCSSDAVNGECVMSRFAALSNTLFYKAWFFGAFYYWCIWVIIGIYFLALIYNIYNACRVRRERELLDSDSEDSDDEPLVIA